MDEKKNEETTKITRSRARHLRRKRLIIARRAAEIETALKTEKPEEIVANHENKTDNCQGTTEILSKSKARRLRKKKKTQNLSENSLSLSFDNSELNSTNPNSPTDESRSESHANTQEIINNEKNLKINESLINQSRINKLSSSELIINKLDENKIEFNDLSCNSQKDDVSHEMPVSNVPESSKTEKNKVNCVISKEIKMNAEGKTREQIKAEREAKKAAKAAAKNKGKTPKADLEVSSSKIPIQSTDNSGKKSTQAVINPVDGEAKPNARHILSDEDVEKEIPLVTEELSKLTVSDFAIPSIKSTCVNEERIGQPDGNFLIEFPKNLTVKLEQKQEVERNEMELKNAVNEGKTKAELRAERRLKQEAQRAAKGQQKKSSAKPVEPIKVPKVVEKSQVKAEDSPKKVTLKKPLIKESSHELNLFKHLYHEREQAFLTTPTVNSSIHPAIVRLGVQYANKIIVGSNARCIALLAAVKQLIEDFERPSQADFTRGLETTLQESSSYLHHCRPLAVSMCNALRHLKWQMTQLPSTISDDEAKAKLGNAIDTYIQEQILLADQAISITIQTKISNGDVILTYGYSSLIQKILCDAHDKEKKFRVVVVDGRPWLEGRELLRRLAKHGVECSYVLINALSFIMPEVSKVFLGAHAILANGAVMSRAGTAQVALMAKAYNVPVLVACETHKSCERVQTDSIVQNEIGNADELALNIIGSRRKTSALTNWRAKKSLNILNLTYDVTPADLVTAVVTELAILPCTSVPVILRIKPSEI